MPPDMGPPGRWPWVFRGRGRGCFGDMVTGASGRWPWARRESFGDVAVLSAQETGTCWAADRERNGVPLKAGLPL